MMHKMTDLLNHYSLIDPITCAFCRTKGTNQTKQNSAQRLEIRGMEDAKRTYNYEDEVRVSGLEWVL
jgi:hypothetical protein